MQLRHHQGNTTPLVASLLLTAFASTGTSVIWNGLPFIGKRDFGFSEKETLSLFLLIGVVYVLGALCSGKITRWLQTIISTRAIIGVLLLAQTIACSMPLFFEGAWVVWCAGGVAGACSSVIWPIVESYLVSGRHGKEMRRVIGWWNIVWMSSVAAVMFGMAPMMQDHATMVIVVLGAMNIVAMCALPWYGKNPSSHDEEQILEHVPANYRSLLLGARIILPLSYVMNGVLSPLLPFIVSGLDVPIFWQTPLVGAWMVSRVGITAIMGQFSGWHGRWSLLWGALLVMTIGFACVLSASNVTVLLLGLILFGVGAGVTYYAGLYYAMSVGKAEVDAGGTHEALIGGGYMVGPIVGLATIQMSNETQLQSFQPIIIVILVLL
ncbi:MAG: MFS transporter, partial [Phycisphaerae bacterium]|nr:MFS transporter [Phycisphaerae bacterium]